MNSGLDRFEWIGLARPTSGWHGRLHGKALTGYFKFGLVWLPAVLIAGLGTWMLVSGYASKPAEGEPVIAAVTDPAPPAGDPAIKPVAFNPATSEAITPEQATPLDGLKISSQSWRRGGFGSKALITFTLRNSNNYAVRDIEISCAFARRDGSHLTDRSRLIPDIVNMKSRKTFARLHVGFVNVNASGAKCSLVTATRI
ncbi:hypothetical protein [Bradyrhizobium sp. dw_411]|uniref:hypothetical protein n=1 Tax=Bradyrhizobium sp. dw_411 TaxID=2720082 RepID=UPI001BCB3E52|nr:hypothetical protein [Bradyrhizobium sp. dw_411]